MIPENKLRKRDPALASGILAFVALLVMAVLLFTLMNPPISEITSMMSARNPPAEAQTAIDTRESIWGAMLFYVIFLGTIMVIARAVVESRRPG